MALVTAGCTFIEMQGVPCDMTENGLAALENILTNLLSFFDNALIESTVEHVVSFNLTLVSCLHTAQLLSYMPLEKGADLTSF